MTYLSNCRFSHQWNDNSASVFVKLRGLHHDDERNRFFLFPGVPVHIELSH